jgi:hypothetical protein
LALAEATIVAGSINPGGANVGIVGFDFIEDFSSSDYESVSSSSASGEEGEKGKGGNKEGQGKTAT